MTHVWYTPSMVHHMTSGTIRTNTGSESIIFLVNNKSGPYKTVLIRTRVFVLLDEQVKRGKKYILVCWKNGPEKFNSLVSPSQLTGIWRQHHGGFNYLFCYTDLVQHQLVGTVYSPFLHTVTHTQQKEHFNARFTIQDVYCHVRNRTQWNHTMKFLLSLHTR